MIKATARRICWKGELWVWSCIRLQGKVVAGLHCFYSIDWFVIFLGTFVLLPVSLTKHQKTFERFPLLFRCTARKKRNICRYTSGRKSAELKECCVVHGSTILHTAVNSGTHATPPPPHQIFSSYLVHAVVSIAMSHVISFHVSIDLYVDVRYSL